MLAGELYGLNPIWYKPSATSSTFLIQLGDCPMQVSALGPGKERELQAVTNPDFYFLLCTVLVPFETLIDCLESPR
jgi:hypothetical protein